MDYSQIYHYDYFKRADGIRSWEQGKLKFGDAFAAVCYAHGIYWDDIIRRFPTIGPLGKYEGTLYTLDEQINFLNKHKTRMPNKVLEIGGGRGEVTCVLANMGYDVVSIEPAKNADRWFKETNLKFFKTPGEYTLLNGSVTDYIEHPKLATFDTVIMVESLEHILEEDFDPIYQKILSVLKNTGGVLSITNWKDYHPLPIGWQAPPEEHCRLVDDALYEEMTQDFSSCLYRDGSHLCLKM